MPSQSAPPLWRERHQHSSFPAAPFADLLGYAGSLTSELLRLGRGDFRLDLLHHDMLVNDDRLLHHERDGQWPPCLCREVVMHVAGRPTVAARTLVPAATAQAEGWLSSLGARSLGAALFERQDVTRSPFEFALHHRGDDLVARVESLVPSVLAGANEGEELWARRSRFAVGGHPLMVMELFLPPAYDLAGTA